MSAITSCEANLCPCGPSRHISQCRFISRQEFPIESHLKARAEYCSGKLHQNRLSSELARWPLFIADEWVAFDAVYQQWPYAIFRNVITDVVCFVAKDFHKLESSKDRPLVPSPAEVKWPGRRRHAVDDNSNANARLISATSYSWTSQI